MRRGCAHATEQPAPRPASTASSSRYCGTCVLRAEAERAVEHMACDVVSKKLWLPMLLAEGMS